MDNIIIKKDIIEGYEDIIGNLQFLIRSSTNDSKKILEALKIFLLDYFKSGNFTRKALNSQNIYFSKKQAEQFIEIVKDNLSISDKTIESYINKIFKEIDFSKYVDYNNLKILQAFVIKELEKILDGIDKPQNKQKTSSSSNSSKNTVNESSNSIKYKQVNQRLIATSIELGTITSFLRKNVFSNLGTFAGKKSLSFSNDSVKLVKPYFSKGTFFTKLYIPNITKLKTSFRKFERNITSGIISKVKTGFSKLKTGLYNVVNLFFPLGLIKAIFKTGTFLAGTLFKITKGVISLGYKLVKTSLSLAIGTIKFAISTVVKIGTGAINLLGNTFKRLGDLKILKFTSKVALRFLKTYTGAYLLGWLIGSIYKNIGKIFEFGKNLLNDTKNWFTKNIYTPWIEPIFKWFNGMGYNIYLSLITDKFDQGSSISEDVENVLSLFRLENNVGHAMFNIASITREIQFYTTYIEETFTGENLKEIILNNVASIGGSMLGSIAGAKLGAALGTLIAPGIGTVVGGIIGSLLGGWAGEKLGGYLINYFRLNIPYSKVDKIETPFEEYTANALGLRPHIAREKGLYNEKSENVTTIKNFSERILNFHSKEDFLKNIETLYDFGINVGINTTTPLSNDDLIKYNEQFLILRNLDKLSSQSVFNEIQDAAAQWSSLLGNNNGLLFIDDVRKNGGYNSNLSLNDNYKVKEKPYLNPYAFRIFRALSINTLMNLLANNDISLFGKNGFVEEYDKLEDPDKLDSEILNGKINFNNKEISVEDFLYPQREKNTNAFINTLSDIIPDRFKYKHMSRKKIKTRQRAKSKTTSKKISYDKVKNNLVYVLPKDKSNGFFNDFFKGKDLRDLSFQTLFKFNVKKQTRQSILSDGDLLSLAESFNLDPITLDAKIGGIKRIDDELSLKFTSEEISAMKDEGTLTSVIEEIVSHILYDIIPDFSKSNIIGGYIGKQFDIMTEELLGFNEEDSQKLLDLFGKKTDLDVLRSLILRYDLSLSKNTKFLNEKVIPFLQSLKDKGVKEEEIGQIFGLIYKEGRVTRYESPTSSVTGKSASPSVE